MDDAKSQNLWIFCRHKAKEGRNVPVGTSGKRLGCGGFAAHCIALDLSISPGAL